MWPRSIRSAQFGWTPDDYKMNFGGTSAATPLAAGIAALMLSVNPSLTVEEIRGLMHNTCDKIGGVTYTGGTNRFYGYGRVNAFKAVDAAMHALSINDVTVAEDCGGNDFHRNVHDHTLGSVSE